MQIDAHHHLWDLQAVHYPWLAESGAKRFFGDPTPIQRDYLIDEFRKDASAQGFSGSVHIQVGAANPVEEAQWVQRVADLNPDWSLVQVPFCDLTREDVTETLDALQKLPTVRGVRQIVGRSPDEDAATGTNSLLNDPRFGDGLRELGRRGLSFDLQLIPDLIPKTAHILEAAPETPIALCHAGSPYQRSAAGLAVWSGQLKDLADLPHVFCKLSGLGMFEHDWSAESIRPIVESCLEHFSPNRCMFGSNFPVDSLTSDYQTLVDAYRNLVPQVDWPDVFGETATAFYRI